MTVHLFLVHHLCGDFWVFVERLLIPSLENLMFIFTILFKIEIEWASLIDDVFYVLTILVADE